MRSPDFQSKLSELSVTLQKGYSLHYKYCRAASVAKTQFDEEGFSKAWRCRCVCKFSQIKVIFTVPGTMSCTF